MSSPSPNCSRGKPFTPFQKEYIRHDGRRIPVLVGGALLPNCVDQGIAFALNLTGRSSPEQAINAYQEAITGLYDVMLEVNRPSEPGKLLPSTAASMPAVPDDVALLAHELRQPLGTILANAQSARRLLRQHTPNLEDLRTIVSDLIAEDRRAAQLLNQGRFSVLRRKRPLERVNLNTLIGEVLQGLRNRLAAGDVQSHVTFSDDVPEVRGDRLQLYQLFLNIFSNACDALDHTPRAFRCIFTRTFTYGGHASLIEIRDTGPGIPPEHLEKIFKPFVSSKRGERGIGLYLSRVIVRFHGGQITNAVDGILAVGPGTHSFSRTLYYMTDGLLTTKNTTMDFSSVGGFTQNGGVHRIANELSIAGPVNGPFPYLGETWWGYRFHGGELIVSNIVVHPRSAFTCRGGTLRQSGTIRLVAATLNFGLAPQQFGPLQLETSESGTYTTNTIHFPDGYGVLRFANSTAMPWAGNAKLIITDWGGPLQGGGPEQVIFGNSASGLTAAQLSKIWFRTPAGMVGVYPTRILPTGEIVPDLRTSANSPRLSIRKPASNLAYVTVTGDPGRNYGVYQSANLINWDFWTNRVATNGTMTLQDTATFDDRRFYKAIVLP